MAHNKNIFLRDVFFLVLIVAIAGCEGVIVNGMSNQNGNSGKGDIYGEDDRLDPRDLSYTIWDRWAKSTALLVNKNELTPDGTGYQILNSQRFGDITDSNNNPLCNDVRFVDQPRVGFCSAFLVGQNVVATAGHCLLTTQCSDIAVVFGYGYYSTYNENVLRIPNANIYYCKSPLIAQKYETTPLPQDQQDDGRGGILTDYGIMYLDRPVTDRLPLKIRKTGRPDVGTPIVAIGHPYGLPTKIARGQIVDAPSFRNRFFINSDLFPGNSGGAVINELSGEVEGIAVTASGDYFEYSPVEMCNRLRECVDVDVTQPGCPGVGATYAELFAPILDSLF